MGCLRPGAVGRSCLGCRTSPATTGSRGARCRQLPAAVCGAKLDAEPSSGADMRGLVASPAARLATATATASDGPQGHLRPLKIQRTCNRLGDTSVHDVPETYCSAEGRNRRRSASVRSKPHRHGHRLERLSLRVHHRRGRLGVPPLPISRDPTPAASAYSHGTLAEILRRVFGTRASEVAQ